MDCAEAVPVIKNVAANAAPLNRDLAEDMRIILLLLIAELTLVFSELVKRANLSIFSVIFERFLPVFCS